ncbi:MAG: cation:proton antiporter [Thermodesulfobacteriota bacterium]
MENIPLLKDIVILVAVSVPISMLFTRIGLPTIVGFLITGVIAGPHGLGLITDMHSVEVLAEIGIVLLLFTIGIEFSITKILKIRREAIIGGGLQVVFAVVLVLIFSMGFGFSFPVALLLGFIVSLSSTAITMKLLLDKGEISSRLGNLSIAILLFQDLAVVFMVIVVQSFGARGVIEPMAVAKGLGIAVAAVVIIVLLTNYLIPKLFYQVVRLRSREVFILTIVLVCLGTALVSSLFGLSLAIGAFIAGLVISESEYSNQIVADVMPFRDTFSSLFFASIGMLLELNFLIQHLPLILLIALGVIIVKAVILAGVGQILKYPLSLSIIVGINLAQIGEFSFILIKMGQSYALLDPALYQTLLAVSIITMAATPLFFKLSPSIAFSLGGFLEGKVERVREAKKAAKTTLSNHVIIIGYGLNGRNLATVLKKTIIAHLVIDMSADRVKAAKSVGHQAFYGDASHPDMLARLGIEKAKMVVVAITDPIATRRIVKTARDMNPAAMIIVRTRYTREMEDLKTLGATQVIPEEFETSVEIFARVLRSYRIPANIVQNQIDIVREEGYAMLRTPYAEKDTLSKLTSILEATTMDTFYVDEGCNITNTMIKELNLRKESGATIIAIARKGKAYTNPEAEFKIQKGDILVLLGSHAELHQAFEILKFRCPV